MTNEQIEKIINERNDFLTKPLTPRQHRLKDYLKDNFVSGKYFTIEEICEAGLGFELNTNPKAHDKCIALSNDIKQLNWLAGIHRYIPIVKDSRGACKLAENEQELKDYVASEKRKVEKVNQYANHLQSLVDLEGTTPFINQVDRVLEEKEITPIEVYAK